MAFSVSSIKFGFNITAKHVCALLNKTKLCLMKNTLEGFEKDRYHPTIYERLSSVSLKKRPFVKINYFFAISVVVDYESF